MENTSLVAVKKMYLANKIDRILSKVDQYNNYIDTFIKSILDEGLKNIKNEVIEYNKKSEIFYKNRNIVLNFLAHFFLDETLETFLIDYYEKSIIDFVQNSNCYDVLYIDKLIYKVKSSVADLKCKYINSSTHIDKHRLIQLKNLLCYDQDIYLSLSDAEFLQKSEEKIESI